MMRHRPQSGFTLLEMLLAMGMVAVLGASLYETLHTALKARDQAGANLVAVRSTQAAMELIRTDLESALPPTGILAGEFLGSPDSTGGVQGHLLEFYCVGSGPELPDPTGQGGVRRVELCVVPWAEDGQPVLVRRITTNLLAQVESAPNEEVLCRGVRAFAIRYFDGSTWEDYWDSTTVGDVLPIAVEITLQVADSSRRDEPGRTYTATRIFRLACHKEPEESEAQP